MAAQGSSVMPTPRLKSGEMLEIGYRIMWVEEYSL